MTMKRVVLESPYGSRVDGSRCDARELAENVAYARLCLADSLARGEAPFASHLLYPQCLDDATPSERQQGMMAGFEWGKCAELCVVYTDRGITPGMKAGIQNAFDAGLAIERRTLKDR